MEFRFTPGNWRKSAFVLAEYRTVNPKPDSFWKLGSLDRSQASTSKALEGENGRICRKKSGLNIGELGGIGDVDRRILIDLLVVDS